MSSQLSQEIASGRMVTLIDENYLLIILSLYPHSAIILH